MTEYELMVKIVPLVKDFGKDCSECVCLGYKIKHVGGEVSLYTNLEIEIARFNSRGVLRPLHWGGSSRGEGLVFLG